MGDARTVAASVIITNCLYELRDPDGTNYNKDGAYAELLGYINRCLEVLYEILVYDDSELTRTGTGDIATVDGTQSYDMSDNDMGDLWIPHRVWVDEYPPMKMCEEEDLYGGINAEESENTAREQPDQYCIIGDYIWFKTVPDDAYTVYFRYYPNFTPLTLVTESMPYKNIFNNEVIEGVKVLAKHRNEIGIQVDAILKDIFNEKAMRIMRKRRTKSVRIFPGRR